jgi:flagellar motor switch/type III secretory pathway protein FliN
MHQQLASEWSEQMREYLCKGDSIRFCGFDFESCGQSRELDCETACSIVFSFDRSQVIGVIGLSEELARYLVDRQLGESPGTQQFERPAAQRNDRDLQRPAPFTRLESALLKRSLVLLLKRLGTVYASAGIGLPKPSDQAGRVYANLGVLPGEPLVVFRYKVGEADSPRNLFIASTMRLVDAVQDAPHSSQPGDGTMLLAATTAPLDVKLVLGNWNVTIEELCSLRCGDEIILPDGTDGRLTADSIPVKRVRVKLSDDRIAVALKGGPSGAQ